MTETKIKHTLDARGKRLGRIASEAAALLIGKDSVAYERHVPLPVEVTIEHASEMFVKEKKRLQKKYTHYTGYQGGLRKNSMSQVISKNGYAEILRRAIYGMVPSNKLRSPRMKQLIIHE
jgi:large subunit ribosomal protein L13